MVSRGMTTKQSLWPHCWNCIISSPEGWPVFQYRKFLSKKFHPSVSFVLTFTTVLHHLLSISVSYDLKNSLSNILVSANEMMPWYRTLAYLLHTFDSELTLGFTDEWKGRGHDEKVESIKSRRQKLKLYQLLDVRKSLEANRPGENSLEG